MSATAPLRRPAAPPRAPRPAPALPQPASRPRPRLELVRPARTSAGRWPFVILLAVLLVGGLVGLLMLHTLAAQDGFHADALQARVSALVDQEQHLELVNQRLAAPSVVQAKAKALGMRPTTVKSFHRLADGRAVGVQVPVTPAPPVVAPSTAGTAGSGSAAASTTTPSGKSPAGHRAGPGKHAGTGTTKPTGVRGTAGSHG